MNQPRSGAVRAVLVGLTVAAALAEIVILIVRVAGWVAWSWWWLLAPVGAVVGLPLLALLVGLGAAMLGTLLDDLHTRRVRARWRR